MDRTCSLYRRTRRHAPHARGDGPHGDQKKPLERQCSPRTWGWTVVKAGSTALPASCSPRTWGWTGIRGRRDWVFSDAPHARGDGPAAPTCSPTSRSCSPRTWGWTDEPLGDHPRVPMLPTHVGMDPEWPGVRPLRGDAPHARGDGPEHPTLFKIIAGCSPRTWGWTVTFATSLPHSPMLPTHVGMDRR